MQHQRQINKFPIFRALQVICTGTLMLLMLLVGLIGLTCQSAAAESVYESFQKLKIPDLIPVQRSTPTIRVELKGQLVNPMDAVPARNFKNLDLMKGITWNSGDSETKYTLMLLDLDRTPHPNGTLNIYNQYTNVNIPGSQIISGQAIAVFEPPRVPCQPSSKHRIVMLVFRQNQNIDLTDVAHFSAPAGNTARREHFKLDEFIRRSSLELAAANVFLALGDINGVCSSGATLLPQHLTTSGAMILMVIVHKMLSRHHH